MPHLDQLDLAPGPVHRSEETVDAVTRIAEDRAHAPLMQALPKEVADRLNHVAPHTSGMVIAGSFEPDERRQ
jgi:hypothetical protein